MPISYVTCENCGRRVSPYAQKCIYCGALRGPRCPACLEPVNVGALKCPHCGLDLPQPADLGNVVLKPKLGTATSAPPVRDTSHPAPSRFHAFTARLKEIRTVLLVSTFLLIALGAVTVVAVQQIHMRRQIRQCRDRIISMKAKADSFAAKGEYPSAIKMYLAALNETRSKPLRAPTLEEEILAGLKNARIKEAVVEERKRRHRAAVQGYIACGSIGIRVAKVGPGFYSQRPCLEIWVKVFNLSGETAAVSPADFAIKLPDNRYVSPQPPVEPFHFPSTRIRPGMTASGVLPFVPADLRPSMLVYKATYEMSLPQ